MENVKIWELPNLITELFELEDSLSLIELKSSLIVHI